MTSAPQSLCAAAGTCTSEKGKLGQLAACTTSASQHATGRMSMSVRYKRPVRQNHQSLFVCRRDEYITKVSYCRRAGRLYNRQHALAVQMPTTPGSGSTGLVHSAWQTCATDSTRWLYRCNHAQLRQQRVSTDHRALQTCATDNTCSMAVQMHTTPGSGCTGLIQTIEHGRPAQQTAYAGCTDAYHTRLRQHKVSTQSMADLCNRQHALAVQMPSTPGSGRTG